LPAHQVGGVSTTQVWASVRKTYYADGSEKLDCGMHVGDPRLGNAASPVGFVMSTNQLTAGGSSAIPAAYAVIGGCSVKDVSDDFGSSSGDSAIRIFQFNIPDPLGTAIPSYAFQAYSRNATSTTWTTNNVYTVFSGAAAAGVCTDTVY
jgi:hypothetical protein